MEHRVGKLEDAFAIYDQAIAKEQSQSLPMLFIQYAGFNTWLLATLRKLGKLLIMPLTMCNSRNHLWRLQ
ncbi:hypothetical protein ACHQM5_014406 [Ranunculus cassubicifolius]